MATAAYKKGKLYDLPIGDLNPDPNQPWRISNMKIKVTEEIWKEGNMYVS